MKSPARRGSEVQTMFNARLSSKFFLSAFMCLVEMDHMWSGGSFALHQARIRLVDREVIS